MIKSVVKTVEVPLSISKAYDAFIDEIHAWWPQAYTWSQDQLEKIFIERGVDGLCTEIGPYGFRCDWGRVTALSENERIQMKWQISPNREPIPNPALASDIDIQFDEKGSALTQIRFEHSHFEHHGEEAQHYRDMMDSDQGWTYILDQYKTYCDGKVS